MSNGLTVTPRRGFFRLWAVASAAWLIFLVVEYRHTNILELPPADLQRLLLIGAGPPILVFVLGCVIGWVISGFLRIEAAQSISPDVVDKISETPGAARLPMDRPAPPRPQSSGRISWLLAALSLAVVGAIAATQLPLSLLTGDSEEITRERVEAGFDRAFSSFESKLALQELKQGFPDEYAEMLRTMVDLRLSHAPTLTPEELAQEEAVLRNWLRDFYLRNQRYVPDAPALELLALWRSDLDALIQLQRVSDFQCAGRVRGKLHLDVSPAKETLELLDRAAAARIVAMRAGRDKPFGQSEFGVSDLKEINSGLRARSATEEFINAFTLGGTDELGGAELCDGMVKLYRTVAEAPASKAARWARFIEGMAGPPRPAK